jgi:hypothetical protein
MNQQKIRELCAKVRGISPAEMAAICYDPLDDANQADDLLEYVADGRGYGYMSHPVPHAFITPGEQFRMEGKNEKEAKVLCALRASPEVTAEELADAMEE